VGIVHAERPAPDPVLDPVVIDLHRRVRAAFDPTRRLNPGRVPW
jgi:FAD/FMN-containing dehydrogenase